MGDATNKQLVYMEPKITAQERARRQAQLDYARGSLRLEGFVASEEVEIIGRRYVDGEISLKEHSTLIRQRYGSE
jgi:hypothetical protein